MNTESVGQRIRRIRREQGMRICDLAQRAHTNHTTVTTLELGRTNANMWTFIEIARVLGVSLDYLVYGTIPSNGCAPAIHPR